MLKNQWSKKEIEDSEYEIHHRALVGAGVPGHQ